MGVGALCGAASCGSDVPPTADASPNPGVTIVDAGRDASSDVDPVDGASGTDVDEARPDRDATSAGDNRGALDIFVDDRAVSDVGGDSVGTDGGSIAEGRPSDEAVLRDMTSSDGSGAVSDAIPDRISPDADPPDDGGMRCNGYEALCDRRFDEVVFPTAHNAMSNADDGWVAPNQQHGMKRQLEDGIRGMLIDTHSYMGSTYLCHSSCLLGNKPLADALREVTTFLEGHPSEVLTFIIEDHISATETETAFNASGLADYVYVHPAGTPWPTLRAMITSGRRVLVGAESGSPPPGFYHHFYDLAWDTPYSFKSTSDFSCQQNRGTRQNALFLLNHWLENPLPDENLSRTANAHDVLFARARQCQMESGKVPNFVAVSHYAVGDLFAVVRELNGL